MKSLGSVASLVEAVREEVESEVGRIRQESEMQQVELRQAAAASAPVELPGRLERLAEERRKLAEGLAREDWADRREALEDREAFVADVVQEGFSVLTQAKAPNDRRELLARLIAEGLARLPGEVFEIALSADDAESAGEDFLAQLAQRCGKREVRLAADPLHAAGGCIVAAGDGRAVFDNTFEARSRRFEPDWRAAIAEIYGP